MCTSGCQRVVEALEGQGQGQGGASAAPGADLSEVGEVGEGGEAQVQMADADITGTPSSCAMSSPAWLPDRSSLSRCG